MEALLLTFRSVNHTMLTEKILKEEDKKIKVIPTPRQISQSCGLAIMMDMSEQEEMIQRKEQDLPIAYIWKYKRGEEGASAEQVG
ncbi:MAG: DUF3343 domain-containing protein [Gallicola sp.]|nr:DUF3343 domain-containing protein [Gallicola sp.]